MLIFYMDHQSILRSIKPDHKFFIGIDSDGCVFDSMEVKQKDFFIPNALKYFDLFQISGILRETWEFVNLYSINRGGNRFLSIIKVFDLLKGRKEIIESGCKLPDLRLLKLWVRSETKLGNSTLRKFFELNYDPDLEKVLLWSEAVNKDISDRLKKIQAFPCAVKAIKEISLFADIIIVSQTPLEALEHEWEEHDLRKYVKAIAGQEHGTKSEHISMAATGKYPNNRILMIGDARGDLDAAINNRILFYPIIPGKENDSWIKFLNDPLDRFIKGNYEGEYAKSLLTEFMSVLPVNPGWIVNEENSKSKKNLT